MKIVVTSVMVDNQEKALLSVTTAVFDDTCGNLIQIFIQSQLSDLREKRFEDCECSVWSSALCTLTIEFKKSSN